MRKPTFNDPPIPSQAWKRRAILGGGVVVGAATAKGLWRAVSTGMVLQGDEAFEPWRAWGSKPAGDPLALVGAAILASSPHNTQPWLFVVKDGFIDVRADPSRSLGAMDPYGREMWLGLGAAVANIEIAAPACGFSASTALRPALDDETWAARITLSPAKGLAGTLAGVISKRSTNRAAYDPTRSVSSEVMDLLSKEDSDDVRLVWMAASSAIGRDFAHATLAGTQQINADADMSAAGHRWFRANPKAVAKHRDGVSTPTAGISPLMATLSPLVPPVDEQTAGAYWLRSTGMQLTSAPTYAFIAVRELYDRRIQLLAGARWQRIHLQLTEKGLAAHPLNQLMEIVDRDRQLARPSLSAALLSRLVGTAGWAPTFAFRVGYATREVPHSPRRPLASVLMA
jgi:nitroreductase